MKKFVKAISGERALYIVMVLAVLASVMEIITALRTHVNIDYQGRAHTGLPYVRGQQPLITPRRSQKKRRLTWKFKRTNRIS